MDPHVLRHKTISAKIQIKIDCSVIVFFNMFLKIALRTTCITVQYIQFQILDLDFAIKY